MFTKKNLEDFHDSTLDSVSIQWRERRGTLALKTWNGGPAKMRIEFFDFQDLELPKRAPWGPSSSVNTVSLETPPGARFSDLKVELQSGDTLVIQAKRFELGH